MDTRTEGLRAELADIVAEGTGKLAKPTAKKQ